MKDLKRLTVNYIRVLIFCIIILRCKVDCSGLELVTDSVILDLPENHDDNEVRCYCNLPECITTGYMCKTTTQDGGGCFTDVIVSVPVQRAAHGCLNLLQRSRHTQCRNEPSVVGADDQSVVDDTSDTSASSVSSLLLCCHEDMCNHVDMPENHVKYNDSIIAAALAGSRSVGSSLNQPLVSPHVTSVPYDNNEVWFRAATIAVPICGILILFILITLAIKILRSDTEATANGKLRPPRNGGGSGLPLYTPVQSASNITHKQQLLQNPLQDYIVNDTNKIKTPLLFQYGIGNKSNEPYTIQQTISEQPVVKNKVSPATVTNFYDNRKEINTDKSNCTSVALLKEQNRDDDTFVKPSAGDYSSNINNNNSDKCFSNSFYLFNGTDRDPCPQNQDSGDVEQNREQIITNLISLSNNNNFDNNCIDNKYYLYEKTLLNKSGVNNLLQ